MCVWCVCGVYVCVCVCVCVYSASFHTFFTLALDQNDHLVSAPTLAVLTFPLVFVSSSRKMSQSLAPARI